RPDRTAWAKAAAVAAPGHELACSSPPRTFAMASVRPELIISTPSRVPFAARRRTGQTSGAGLMRHSPPSRPARLMARSRSACRAPADGAFTLLRRPQDGSVISEGLDQLCLGHRGAALAAAL